MQFAVVIAILFFAIRESATLMKRKIGLYEE